MNHMRQLEVREGSITPERDFAGRPAAPERAGTIL